MTRDVLGLGYLRVNCSNVFLSASPMKRVNVSPMGFTSLIFCERWRGVSRHVFHSI